MVSKGYIYVLVRIDGRHMYWQSASLDMSSAILVLINYVNGFDSRRGLTKFF